MQPIAMDLVVGGRLYTTKQALLVAHDAGPDGVTWERAGRNTFLFRDPSASTSRSNAPPGAWSRTTWSFSRPARLGSCTINSRSMRLSSAKHSLNSCEWLHAFALESHPRG